MAPRATHGGPRAGAGRKAGPGGPRAVTLNVRLTEAQAAALDALVSAKGLGTRSAAVAAWLDGAARKAARA